MNCNRDDQSTYEVHEIPEGSDLYEDAISWTNVLISGTCQICRGDAGASAPRSFQRQRSAAQAAFARRKLHHLRLAQMPRIGTEAEYLAARPELNQHVQLVAIAKRPSTSSLPFHDELKPLLSSLPSALDAQRLHASNLFWSDLRFARPAPHRSSISDLADRPTPSTISLRPSNARYRGVASPDAQPRTRRRSPVHLDHLWAMLGGYEQVRPLNAAESAAFVPMLALSHAEFALTEADYFLRVLHSPEKAQVATSDYLVKHAQWFRGPGKEKLLNPLRRWAENTPTPGGKRMIRPPSLNISSQTGWNSPVS